MLAAMLSWIAAHRRSKRLIQALNFRLCPRCRYDLTSSPPDGLCPECGRSYTDADLRNLWCRAYRIKTIDSLSNP